MHSRVGTCHWLLYLRFFSQSEHLFGMEGGKLKWADPFVELGMWTQKLGRNTAPAAQPTKPPLLLCGQLRLHLIEIVV